MPLRVWVSRPAHRNSALAAALTMLGLEPLCCPALHIKPPVDTTALTQYLSAPDAFAASIFVSRDAAQIIAEQLPPNRTGLPALAVGKKTATALPQAYQLLAEPLITGDSRALLRLPVLQNIKTAAVLGGVRLDNKPPSPLLCRVLAGRGCAVHPVPCYTRQAATPDAALSALGDNGEIHAAVAYSTDTVRFMLAMTAPNNAWLRRLPLFVIHDNIKRQARRLGFERVVVVADSTTMAVNIADVVA